MKGTRRPRRTATNAARMGVARAPAIPTEALGPVVRELVGQLWESEQRHRMAFEQSPVGLAYATLDGRFVAANEAWRAVTACTREQLATQSLADLAAPEECERHTRLRRELLTGRIASYTLQTRRARENGAGLWLQLDVRMCRGASGEPLYLLSSVHDISALKDLEERQAVAQAGFAVERAARECALDELRERAASLARANEAMERFFSVASHELLTPVTIIRAATQLLSKRLRRQAQRGAAGESSEAERGTGLAVDPPVDLPVDLEGSLNLLGRIEAQAHALSRTLEDMAQVTRVGAGALDLRLERLDLLALVREVVADQRVAHADRVILLDEAAFERLGGVLVVADGDRIRQVMSNYLMNALKYSPYGAPVWVSVCVERGAVGPRDEGRAVEPSEQKVARVSVRDEGVGIPPDEQPRVWERFHRAPRARAQTHLGANLGLGLYICKSVVERHTGEVGLSSAPGVGSTFWFSLPLARDNPRSDDANTPTHDEEDNRASARSV